MNRSPLQLPSTPAFVQLSVIPAKIARKGFELIIAAKQAVSKRQLRGAKGQSVIPAPLSHSRESGNPGVVEECYSGVSPLYPSWIPAFAGAVVQNISTVEVKAEQAKIVRGTV